MVLKAIQNKRMPTIVAAPSDANSGSVVSISIALVAHLLIHPEAQKDINALLIHNEISILLAYNQICILIFNFTLSLLFL